MSNVLYRIYDCTGALLYVGATINIGQRISDHEGGRPWWSDATRIELQHFQSLEDLTAAEATAIREESPRYNVTFQKSLQQRRKPRVGNGQGRVYRRAADGMWAGAVPLPPVDGKRRRKVVTSLDRATCERKLAALRAAVAAEHQAG